mmetsp:Transcript_29630/g.68651  ORF Transcript_29630/g.68651 Transcript_29630/m.68651 type:complete len:884 (-) Transcript_29630:200-2851(-)
MSAIFLFARKASKMIQRVPSILKPPVKTPKPFEPSTEGVEDWDAFKQKIRPAPVLREGAPWFSASHIFWWTGWDADIDFWYFHFYGSAALCLVVGFIFWLLEDITYTDALFTAVSAFCTTGLATIDIEDWNWYTQLILFLLFLMSGGFLGSTVLLLLRRHHLTKLIHSTEETSGPIFDRNIFERGCTTTLCLVVAGSVFSVLLVIFILLGLVMQDQPNLDNPWWWSLFHSVSAFANAGFSTSRRNLIEVAGWGLLILLGICITLGNTLSPVMLRIVIWGLRVLSADKRKYDQILDYTHVYCSHMYSQLLTKILCCYSVFLTAVGFVIILGIEWNAPAMEDLSSGERLLYTWFTVIAARFAGFNCLDLSKLQFSSLMVVMGLMYLPSVPVVDSSAPASVTDGIEGVFRQHSRPLYSRWTAHILVALFLITLIEEDGEHFSLFSISFECVSAFGTVGYSLGHPSVNASFAAMLRVPSKLCLMYLMMVGRHRDLHSFTNQLRQVELRGMDWPLKLSLPTDCVSEPLFDPARKNRSQSVDSPGGESLFFRHTKAKTVETPAYHGRRLGQVVLQANAVKAQQERDQQQGRREPAARVFSFGNAPDEVGLPRTGRRLSLAQVTNAGFSAVRRMSTVMIPSRSESPSEPSPPVSCAGEHVVFPAPRVHSPARLSSPTQSPTFAPTSCSSNTGPPGRILGSSTMADVPSSGIERRPSIHGSQPVLVRRQNSGSAILVQHHVSSRERLSSRENSLDGPKFDSTPGRTITTRVEERDDEDKEEEEEEHPRFPLHGSGLLPGAVRSVDRSTSLTAAASGPARNIFSAGVFGRAKPNDVTSGNAPLATENIVSHGGSELPRIFGRSCSDVGPSVTGDEHPAVVTAENLVSHGHGR